MNVKVGLISSTTLTVRAVVVVLLLESVAEYKTSKLLTVEVLKLSGGLIITFISSAPDNA